MICSESTSAFGQPRLTNPTLGAEEDDTAGEMVCDIGVSPAYSGDDGDKWGRCGKAKGPVSIRTKARTASRARNPLLYRAGDGAAGPAIRHCRIEQAEGRALMCRYQVVG